MTLKSDRPEEEDAAKLRGFFATKFREHALLHLHMAVDKLLYLYPRIPYIYSTAPRLYLAQKEMRDF